MGNARTVPPLPIARFIRGIVVGGAACGVAAKKTILSARLCFRAGSEGNSCVHYLHAMFYH